MSIKGFFIIENEPLFKAEKELDESIVKRITEQFTYSKNELIDDNYVLAFKQLTEIAVKAMSPGINDPGTALNAIDYLSELFVLRLQKSDYSYTCVDDTVWVSISTVNFSTLLFQVMASLRTYCKKDITVGQRIIKMLLFLKKTSSNKQYTKAIEEELNRFKEDINHAIINTDDLNILNQLF